MNNKELDQLLKSAQVPQRDESYWNNFSKRVTARLHWSRPEPGQISQPALRRRVFAAWGFVLATACVVFGFTVGFWRGKESGLSTQQLAEARKYYHEIEGLFPNQVKAIVFDQKGAHLVLSDSANVPSSPPLLVKICGPEGCKGFITFSGQNIQANGETYQVLATTDGQVMLVGKTSVWAGSNTANLAQSLKIEAKPLEASL
jgi:hypothetical protein